MTMYLESFFMWHAPNLQYVPLLFLSAVWFTGVFCWLCQRL